MILSEQEGYFTQGIGMSGKIKMQIIFGAALTLSGALFLIWKGISWQNKGFSNKTKSALSPPLQVVPVKTKFLCPREAPKKSKINSIINGTTVFAKSQRHKQMQKLRNTPLDLVVQDINGFVWDLYCYRRKKNLVINLWATWCPPCVEELLSLSKMAKKTKDQALVLALSTESEEILSRFIKKAFPDLKKDLKIVSLPEEKLRELFPKDPLPVTYIFNKEGKLAHKKPGSRDWNKKEFIDIVKNPYLKE